MRDDEFLTIDENTKDTDLGRALLRRALGFYSKETVEEFDCGNGGEPVKRKVTKKFNPPDLSALRELLNKGDSSLISMTDAELEAERKRILRELKKGVKIK